MKYILIGISINLAILIINVIFHGINISNKLSRIIELLEGEDNES